MHTSLSWLSTHLDLSAYTTAQLSDLLTFAGVEVEGIDEKGIASDKIVVAQIDSFIQHPNADKLSVCSVNDGSSTTRQIVCGAKNFKAGDKVPLAQPGALLPGGFEIKVGQLRGVESQGMLCSSKEIGLGEDVDGLLILDAASPVGTPLRDLMGKPETVFDLEVTPNRSDLLSHLGMARELSALTGIPLKGPRDHVANDLKPAMAKAAQVSIESESCPFYAARIIRGVKVGPSPAWLAARLESIGLRPINNLVDITNYVLMEMGQPLHAFDLAKLSSGIIVRQAADGEAFKSLDGSDCRLTTDDLVIADKFGPQAIAGVMGGEHSGVTESTTDILLEAAYFVPSYVRRTSRRLGLSSDSSYRFERGVDPQQVLGAAELATQLILEIAGGTAEEITAAGKLPELVHEVALDEALARKLLGMADLAQDEIHSILGKLGLIKKSATKNSSKWTVPSYRLDLQRHVDLVEELARVIGLDRVPSKYAAVSVPSEAADRVYDFAMTLRQSLAHRGFYEAQTLRLISTAQLDDSLGIRDIAKESVPVKNPLSEDHTMLRPSIVPGLLATAALNIRQGAQRLRFFEIGRVFLKLPNGQTREEERVTILLSGPASPSSHHASEPAACDVFDLKGIIETLPGVAGTIGELKRIADRPGFLLTSEWRVGNRNLGWIAQVHPARARQLGARQPVYVAELLLSALRQSTSGPAKFEDLPRFPAITRDVAMELPADTPHAKVAAFFNGLKEPLLIKTELFDVFIDTTGTKLAIDRKSVAWTLTYRASDRTLETAEVELAHGRVVAALQKALPVTIR